jgi:putative sugar O-methyltransferase
MARVCVDNSDSQLVDDPALLDLMTRDMEASASWYRPTNYWAPYCAAVADELRERGLRDFRSRDSDILSTFGAVDLIPRFTPPDWQAPNPEIWNAYLEILKTHGNFWTQGFGVGPDGLNAVDYHSMCARIADQNAARAEIPKYSTLSFSRHGNPQGIEKDGRFATFASLYYFHFACFVGMHERLADIDVVVEIGSGFGGQAEVLKRLYPHLTMVLMDLAPQLYVAERFLSAALPGQVVPYRDTAAVDWAGTLTPGRIHFLKPRAIETLAPPGRVLFWNAASFGEMEPDVVANYAGHVSRFASSMFLMQFFHGKQLGSPGEGGVLRQSTMASYEAAFANFERTAEEEAVLSNGVTVLREGKQAYLNTFWKRR